MLILAFCSVVLTSGLLIFTFYNSFTGQVKSELRNKAIFLEKSLNLESNQVEYMKKLDLSNTELRITLVGIDGTVLYDNTANIAAIENHNDREEIKEARTDGVGEGNRISETIGKETYYYALRLKDSVVLRVSKSTSSIYGVFVGVLPQSIVISFVIFLACLLIAKSLTKKIVDPINRFDFDKNNDTYDELSPFIRTITSQKKQIGNALDEITKKSAVIEAISGSMKEGLILTDKDGVVLSANQSALNILNIKDKPIGKNILELTRIVTVLNAMKLALIGQNSDMVMPASGKTYHVFFSGVDKGALILFLDVTEKAKAEKMRREFTANVSHELKTPLTTISGFAELMSKGMVQPEDVTDVSKKVKSESDRLIVLIEDIMRLSELDETEGQRVYGQFDLTKVVFEVTESLKPTADEVMLTFELPIEKHIVTANKQMIYEMLYNLIHNAIKYNKPGGKISVALTNTNEDVKISVSDNGIGIDKKHHDRIFERFYRVDKSRSKKIGGTGLGLSIVKHIAAYHDGNVSIQSEINKGTEITVSLPILTN